MPSSACHGVDCGAEPYNRPMTRILAAALLVVAVAACSPTFNWREVRVESTTLRAMLPCKPDSGMRRVPMGGAEVELSVLGCDTGGATFAVLHAEIADAGAGRTRCWCSGTARRWPTCTAPRPRTRPFTLAGRDPAAAARCACRCSASAPDGSAVRGEAAYFARGTHVFQAVVYADEPKPECGCSPSSTD